MNFKLKTSTLAIGLALSGTLAAGPNPNSNGIGPGFDSDEAAMITGLAGYEAEPAWTVGETVGGFQAPGIPDGMGMIVLDEQRVRLFVNHELNDNTGYTYQLANGTELTGARVSYLDFHRQSRKLLGSGPAYDTVIDRYGNVVTDAAQINEGAGGPTDGFDRFCSAWMGLAGQYGLVDDIFFTGEETGDGQEFAVDARNGVIYAVPALGRAAFESVTMVDHPDPNKVAVLIGDDRAPAPLLMFVGTKNYFGDGSFLDRNGLASGQGSLYVWVADDGSVDPRGFAGTGSALSGNWVEIPHYDPAMAGMPGYDAQGYADQGTQDLLASAAGAFMFSRPEDISTNPANGSQVVLASTGRQGLFDNEDLWGDTYVIDVDLSGMTADINLVYDGDDAGGQFPHPDYGLRSPDNLVWAGNGMIYLQEDRAISSFIYGQTSGEESSIWRLDPLTSEITRVGQIDRSAVPDGQTDGDPDDLGDWESSGIIDVTDFFRTSAKERLYLANVQAHSIRDGVIAVENLVQGGQVFFLSVKE